MSDAYTEAVYDDGRGRVVARRQAQLFSLTVSGYAEEAMVHWYIREFHAFVDALTRKGDIFHDWSAVTGFSSDARRVFLKWGRERNTFNRSVCRGVHILADGALVYLALEAAATFTRGYMTAHRSRRTFELDRDARLRRPSTEPIVKLP
jgi:hypothetical protein